MTQARTLLNTVGNTTGNVFADNYGSASFQATITSSNNTTVSCTITIQCSLDTTNWIDVGTITLSGNPSATDGFYCIGQWVAYRAKTSAVTGSVADITVNIGTA